MIRVLKGNIKLKLALAITTGAPIILAKEIIDIPQLVADKAIKILYYLQFLENTKYVRIALNHI